MVSELHSPSSRWLNGKNTIHTKNKIAQYANSKSAILQFADISFTLWILLENLLFSVSILIIEENYVIHHNYVLHNIQVVHNDEVDGEQKKPNKHTKIGDKASITNEVCWHYCLEFKIGFDKLNFAESKLNLAKRKKHMLLL